METVSCVICGTVSVSVFLSQRDLLFSGVSIEFTVTRCTSCGLLFLNPRPDRSEIGQFYPEQYFSNEEPKQRTVVQERVRRWSDKVKVWIRQDFYGYPCAVPAGFFRSVRKFLLWPEKVRRVLRGREFIPWCGQGRLLDVGCGPGGNLTSLKEQGWDVHGLDSSPIAVQRARAQFGERVQLGELQDVRYEAGAFDVVTLSHSLEHVFSPLAVLRECRRVLAEHGLLVITVPNAGSLEARLFGRWWFPWELPRHLYHFEKTTLCQLLEHAGFRVIRSRTGVGSLFFMASLERAWKGMFGGPLPVRWLIERLIARPFSLIAGHLGYGTELKVYAKKHGFKAPVAARRKNGEDAGLPCA